MTVWRHTGGHHQLATRPDPCTCITPQPDPSSPCGYTWPDGDSCAMTEGPHHRPFGPAHPHVPTLCLHCGHGLEAA